MSMEGYDRTERYGSRFGRRNILAVIACFLIESLLRNPRSATHPGFLISRPCPGEH